MVLLLITMTLCPGGRFLSDAVNMSFCKSCHASPLNAFWTMMQEGLLWIKVRCFCRHPCYYFTKTLFSRALFCCIAVGHNAVWKQLKRFNKRWRYYLALDITTEISFLCNQYITTDELFPRRYSQMVRDAFQVIHLHFHWVVLFSAASFLERSMGNGWCLLYLHEPPLKFSRVRNKIILIEAGVRIWPLNLIQQSINASEGRNGPKCY